MLRPAIIQYLYTFYKSTVSIIILTMSKLLTYNLLLIVIVLFIKSLIGGPYNDEYYKNLYIKRRKDVRNNRDCMTELERWKDKDNDYPYHYL